MYIIIGKRQVNIRSNMYMKKRGTNMMNNYKSDEANKGCNYIKQQIVLLTLSGPNCSSAHIQ
jgi:hypothetical protein